MPSPSCPYIKKLDPYSQVTQTPYSAGNTKNNPNIAEKAIPYATEAKYEANYFMPNPYTITTEITVIINCNEMRVLSFFEGLTLTNAKINLNTVISAQKIELKTVAYYLVEIYDKTA